MTLLDTFFNLEVLGGAFPALLRGLLNTFLLGLAGIGFGIPFGLLIGLLRLYGPKPVRLAAVFYIDILRATPMLVVLLALGTIAAVLGASAVLAASIFHFGQASVAEAKAHMAAAGLAMRLDGPASSARAPL